MASEARSGGSRRLALIGPAAAALVRLRGGFIKDCLARGVRVLALVPELTAGGAESLRTLGAEAKSFAPELAGFTLFPERRVIAALSDQLRQWHPQGVLAFGAPLPIAVKAARRAHVPRVVVIVNELEDGALPSHLRAALKSADAVIAHNRDDARRLMDALAPSSDKVHRVAGAGADLSVCQGRAMPASGDPVIFLAASRLDRVKGVLDYLEAARLALQNGAAAKFILAGPDGSSGGAIKAETIARYAADVHYIGDRGDLAAAIGDAHVFVTPSHREGMPHAALQAMAAGRPIIAADSAGCRETVDEMVNGTLVAPGSPQALADGFQRLIRNRALLPAMGRASRAKAERGFSADAVHAALRDALGLG
ncbi:MAG: glycosyltransferase [Hyphomicrobium sp.]